MANFVMALSTIHLMIYHTSYNNGFLELETVDNLKHQALRTTYL